MSLKTWVKNLRTNRKIAQEKINAAGSATETKHSWIPALAAPFAVAFMFMLVAVQSAAASDINLSMITDVINAFIGILEPITNLIIAIVPLWFVLQILAFIMGLMAAVLAMIKFGGKK